MPDVSGYLEKYEQLSKLLEETERTIVEQWLPVIPARIERNLDQKLFVVYSGNLLQLNFTDEVLS